jgi:hypothetical protein
MNNALSRIAFPSARRVAMGAAVLGLLFPVVAAQAGQAGEVTHSSGVLSVKHADGSSAMLGPKSGVLEGDTLTTEAGAYARVKFVDGGEVVLRPGTQIKVESYQFDNAKPQSDNMLLSMFKGGLRAVTGILGKRSQNRVAFKTETATIGIRGTTFNGLLCQSAPNQGSDCVGLTSATGQPLADGLHVEVVDGAIVVSNGAGQQVFAGGQFGFVKDARTAPAILPPAQGMKFTLPPSQGGRTGGAMGGGDDCVL